jgi:hypothetical protein
MDLSESLQANLVALLVPGRATLLVPLLPPKANILTAVSYQSVSDESQWKRGRSKQSTRVELRFKIRTAEWDKRCTRKQELLSMRADQPQAAFALRHQPMVRRGWRLERVRLWTGQEHWMYGCSGKAEDIGGRQMATIWGLWVLEFFLVGDSHSRKCLCVYPDLEYQHLSFMTVNKKSPHLFDRISFFSHMEKEARAPWSRGLVMCLGFLCLMKFSWRLCPGWHYILVYIVQL